jgi:7-cyano-7-deazaguanine synthase
MMTALPEPPRTESVVLCSGGLDSVVLLAWAAEHAPAQPVYVRAGLAWEAREIETLRRIVAGLPGTTIGGAGRATRIRPLAILDFDVRDLYPPSHWALRGTPPAYDTPDDDVYLPGRNILLLSKAAIFAATHDVSRILLGPLAGNPFPDATAAFFEAISTALGLGLAHALSVEAPFAGLHKADVIRLGASLGVPLGATLSCMNPTEGVHCGLCSKCRERRDAFADAGTEDPTHYRAPSPRAPSA